MNTDKNAPGDGRRPIRDLIEALGMAILMAVLLKYFLIEAYVIPTPSMQPTMMGAPEAGQRDRILVDKLYYTISEPKRWDIAVFRYPLRQLQSYVKRIVGVGGDHLFILGGNIHTASGDQKSIQRKPSRVQATLWKQVFPMRRELEKLETGSEPPLLRNYFFAGSAWREDGPAIVAKDPRSTAGEIQFSGKGGELLANHVYDGFDPEVARAIKKEHGNRTREGGKFGVTDVRIQFDLTAEQAPDRLGLGLSISQGLAFGLEWNEGKARLFVGRAATGRNIEKLVQSEPFDLPITPGKAVRIGFARCDDVLFAYRDGKAIQSLDSSAHPVHEDHSPKDVRARMTLDAKGTVRLSNFVIERDLYYTRSGDDVSPSAGIKVPEGHFFMMGDNTLSSEDSRAWRSVTISVDANNRIVSPETPGARTLTGNCRPGQLRELPGPDDNPVPASADSGRTPVVGFCDQLGQMRRLTGEVDIESWGSVEDRAVATSFLVNKDGGKVPVVPKVAQVHFVPREHIQGRPFLNFFRSLDTHLYSRWIR